MDKCTAVDTGSLRAAKRYGIVAMTWTLVAFLCLAVYGILNLTDTRTDVGRSALLTIALTTTLTATIFAALSAFSIKQKRCAKTALRSESEPGAALSSVDSELNEKTAMV